MRTCKTPECEEPAAGPRYGWFCRRHGQEWRNAKADSVALPTGPTPVPVPPACTRRHDSEACTSPPNNAAAQVTELFTLLDLAATEYTHLAAQVVHCRQAAVEQLTTQAPAIMELATSGTRVATALRILSDAMSNWGKPIPTCRRRRKTNAKADQTEVDQEVDQVDQTEVDQEVDQTEGDQTKDIQCV